MIDFERIINLVKEMPSLILLVSFFSIFNLAADKGVTVLWRYMGLNLGPLDHHSLQRIFSTILMRLSKKRPENESKGFKFIFLIQPSNALSTIVSFMSNVAF